ncbi:interferon a3-like [Parambassis ranga]|uniref:Interferon a3-like n=1 Tax=Parambassis ranga TaxID=210632 RepID=A0A6P7ILK9_9TELE|nr:interferon a3-like [Parambassis ranga]
MLIRILCACLVLALCGSGSALSCRWMDQKFRQHSESCLQLIHTMANSSANSTEDVELQVEEEVAFPERLYSQASKASDQDKLAFIGQVLKEVAALFEEDHSSASWEESVVENFLHVVTRQADELLSCAGSQQRRGGRLRQYFSRLSQLLLGREHSAEGWELIRNQVRAHLLRVDQLAASVLRNN